MNILTVLIVISSISVVVIAYQIGMCAERKRKLESSNKLILQYMKHNKVLSKKIEEIKWIKLKANHRSDLVGKILDYEYGK